MRPGASAAVSGALVSGTASVPALPTSAPPVAGQPSFPGQPPVAGQPPGVVPFLALPDDQEPHLTVQLAGPGGQPA